METKKLLDDLQKYKTTNTEFHSGDVLEHSIWSALYTNHFFSVNDKIIQEIDRRLRKTLVAASLLHDIGKGGDEQYIFFDKPSHPEVGARYLDTGLYPNPVINLRKVVDELGETEHYKLITFLVRWHWMIGDVLRNSMEDERAWKLYYEFNLVCSRDQIPYEQRAKFFMCLWVIWESDLLATQRYPYDIDPDMPFELSNPPAPHPGNNMYKILHISDYLPIRQHIIDVFTQGYQHPDFSQEQIEIFGSSIAKMGEKYYERPYRGNPFLWKETDVPKKIRPFREMTNLKDNQQKCYNFLKHSDPSEIPLFAGFPEIANLPKEKLAEIYAITCANSYEYVCPMLRPISENFTGKDIVNIPKNTFLYHGRGYHSCEPPNIDPSRALWLFDKKKDAYTYATGRDDESQYPAENFCWNILTYKTSQNLRLLNLSERSVRDQLRVILKEFPCESWFITIGIMDYLDSLATYSDVLNYMFPKDIIRPEEKTERESHTTADINMARTLGKIFPDIDGWYIENMKPMLPEIAIFNPYNKIKLEKHEYFDGTRMEGLLSRCTTTNTKEICVKQIRKLFQQSQIVCLDYGSDKPIKCYLPEELLNEKIITQEKYQKILAELDKGNIIVKII